MTFWNVAPEPFRKNRWTMTLANFSDGNFTSDMVTYALKKCDKPSYKTSEITHKFGNYNYYYPGRVEWNPINITFAALPKMDKLLMTLLKTAGYHGGNTKNKALQAASKLSFSNSIGNNIRIMQLHEDGTTNAEWWDLKYPFFTNIKFGELSYESDEIIDIELTIRYDMAEYKKADAAS